MQKSWDMEKESAAHTSCRQFKYIICHRRCLIRIHCSLMAKPKRWLMRVTDIKILPTETLLLFIYKSTRHSLRRRQRILIKLFKTIHFLLCKSLSLVWASLNCYLLFERVIVSKTIHICEIYSRLGPWIYLGKSWSENRERESLF